MTSLIPIRVRLAGIVVGGSIALSAAGGATAATPPPTTAPAAIAETACASQRTAVRTGPTVANLIALGDCEIERRFTTLDRLQGTVIVAPFLTASDRSALESELGATRTGLQALKVTIDAETTVASLKTDLPGIATEYRVYVLVVPQVHLTRGADAEAAAITNLTSLAARLGQPVDFAASQGRDVATARTELAAMQASIAAAQAQVGGLSARILPLTPAEWNAGTATPILDAARAAERTAHDDLAAARDQAKAIIAALG